MAEALASRQARLVVTNVYIIGAGMAGLSAAIELKGLAGQLHLFESGKKAGGRCRSYFDKELDCRIDNGNHLLVSSNENTLAYIKKIEADETFWEGEPFFPFFDLETGDHWIVPVSRPGVRRFMRAIPGTGLADWFALIAPIRAVIKNGPVGGERGQFFRRFLSPLVVSALNTRPEEASARLAWNLMKQAFGKGDVIPYFPKDSLSDSLVDPAVAVLHKAGVNVRFSTRLKSVETKNGRVTTLRFTDNDIQLSDKDKVILALPSWVVAEIFPAVRVPSEYRAIVNIHFAGSHQPTLPVVGLVGGASEWVFNKKSHVSVTISAADRYLDWPLEKLAKTSWDELRRAAAFTADMPKYRVVKEKRATFAATPIELKKRPDVATPFSNLFLAGDYTDTGWPATIEGAVKSGKKAAQRVLSVK